MHRLRLLPHILSVLLLPVLACAGAGNGDGIDSSDVLERGRERASDLVALARTSELVSGEEALELLYLERLRLGLGSPFRIMEQALIDERLSPARRRALAEALLAMTADGATYQIDASGVAGPRGRVDPFVGPRHLRLVTGAVSEASDARVGEQAVRLAYLLAQAGGAADAVLVRGAVQAAGLVRDREDARHDARALLGEAQATGRDPLQLLHEWRAARRFVVESPRLTVLEPALERQAIELAPRLAQAIAAIGTRDDEDPIILRRAPPTPLLDAATANVLAQTLEQAPPQAPVAVAVGLAARMYAGSYGVEPDSLAAQLRVRMPDEERLALVEAILLEERPELRPVLSRAVLAAASGLRAYGQEVVWRPGMQAPSTRELVAQFGLADVVFADGLPAAWRPYYRRMIHSALLDLQRVLPALNLTGLTFVIGPVPEGGALALHSPRTRTVYLPPQTGAGTIAHEIAHDLDWQVAQRRYRVRGDYGSDLASRGGRNDRLAATYLGLTGAALVDNAGSQIDRPHHTRPAEIFARSIDWLVAASLARHGRMNGYLTSIQDEVLTGYGTAVPPDVSGRVGAALISILDEVAPVRAETRAWYLGAYGVGHDLSATDLLRAIVDLPGPTAASDAGSGAGADADDAPVRAMTGPDAVLGGALARVHDTAAAAIRMGVCAAPAHSLDPVHASARTGLIQAAARARAFGIARDYVVRIMGRRGEAALAERFRPGPWSTPVDPAQADLLNSLVAAVNDAVPSRDFEVGGWFEPIVAPEC